MMRSTYAFIPGAQKRSEANLLTASSSFAAEQDLSANPLQMTHLLYWVRAPVARKRSKENCHLFNFSEQNQQKF